MKCAFCTENTKERYKKDNVVVFSHFWCLETRMSVMETDSLIDCLVMEKLLLQVRSAELEKHITLNERMMDT